ncbi:MAG: aminotransferase class V-fold PLP-dependent enzyme [Bacilli bacterium]|nr:aminotransferase class V-fold PLP-dependent enzyme [Bacilli bacterium]
MFDVKEIRSQFPMFKQKMQGKPLVFLDSASTTFKPQCVIDAITNYYTNATSNSHRGDYDLAYVVDKTVRETRQAVARFVNSKENEVVFTNGDTSSLNIFAYAYGLKNLKENDEIVLSESEHASNLLPWFQVSKMTGAKIVYVPLNEEGRITVDNIQKVVNKNTKVVSLAHVGNVMGYRIDVEKIAAICHSFGAIFVVDGAQSVPHFKTDFKKWDIDVLTFSGHKMCGPTGIGCLIAKEELLNNIDPVFVGGGMNETFFKPNNMIPFDAPSKFEAGTLNVAGIFGLKAAIEFLESIGMDNIEQYELELHEYVIKKLEGSNIVIYNKTADSGILTFNVPGRFPQDEATYLNYKGIAVRSGLHCDKLLPDFLKVNATCRASFYFYTTKEEIDYLVDCLLDGGDILDAYFN